MAPLRASMALFDEAGMPALREKSVRLTGYLEGQLRSRTSPAWSILTPSDPAWRGAQLSIHVRRNGRTVFGELSERGVICDWREPDVIRIAPAPLYNTFEEAHRFAQLFHEAVARHCA
jgi:kynureninase